MTIDSRNFPHRNSWPLVFGALVTLYTGCSSNGTGVVMKKDGGVDGNGSTSLSDAKDGTLADGSTRVVDGALRMDAIPGTGGTMQVGTGGSVADGGGIPTVDVASSTQDAIATGGVIASGGTPATGGTVRTGGALVDAGTLDVRTGGAIMKVDSAVDVSVSGDTAIADTASPILDTKLLDTGIDVTKDVVALTDVACGSLGEPCCPRETCTAAGTICSSGGGAGASTCTACGATDQPCCEGDVCTTAGTTCQGGGPRGSGTCR